MLNNLKCLPVYRRLSWFLQQLVGLGEMLATKEPSMSRQRRRMHSLQDVVAPLQTRRTQTSDAWMWQRDILNVFVLNSVDSPGRSQLLSSERTTPTAWRRGPAGCCWATEPRRPWTSPSLCLCGSWPGALGRSAQRWATARLASNVTGPVNDQQLSEYSIDLFYFLNIPCLAHPLRSPCPGCWKPSMSDTSSLYMFSKLKQENMKVCIINWLVHSEKSTERHWEGFYFLPGWRIHRSFHTEAQSVGLVRSVIWILTENHHFDLESETELKLKTCDNHFQILQMTRVKERQHTELYINSDQGEEDHLNVLQVPP